jgi:predicted alpha/beta superfamily hydrolase
MKKSLLILIIACITFLVKAQSHTEPIVLAHVDTVYSDILKEQRPIWVYTPPVDTSYFTKPQYPVLYVLDGDGYFLSLVTMIRQLSVINDNTVLPKMIIVGILNTPGNRNRDLTPTKSSFDNKSGKGENFAAFLQQELIPYIDKNYATAPYRTLIGHSLGGLTVINLLLKHTTMFNAYIANEPSMFYDDATLLKQAAPLLKQSNFKGKTLYMGIANTMDAGMDTAQARKDTSAITRHIRAILNLKDVLKANPANGLRWTYKYYPDDDHASVPFAAMYDGLRFVFRNNRFPRNQPQNQYFDKQLSAVVLKKMIERHYELLSADMGYTVRPAESYFNQLGYTFMQLKQNDKAELFFGLTMQYYPGSFNVYDSMGDLYLALNNKIKAIKYFKKALSIKYRKDIAEKLQKLI